ncbi:MAG: hypothetical protein JOZ41_12235, partial [Chloroflexi bacterium]|nr:hypothetical protein [Chloroflexota bacterium]
MLGRGQSGERISLVPRLPEHIDTIYGWFDDPEFFPRMEPTTFDQYVERYERHAKDNDYTLWSIVSAPDVPGFDWNGDGEEGPEIIGITELVDFTGDRGCLSSFLYIVPSARGQ